ncbi:MAG: relaxase domain-containing protein [Planctomycetales bacterium]|nr:relaxase domain-containing protein [Planctomycetales bacterium]
MIRITQQNSADGAKRYYATADYYSEGQELVGSWGGKAAERLGLSGTVDKASFERLCDNLDPRTGKALTVRNRSERTVGYDFTFSVPKSVSLLYAMTSDPAMLKAFREAVAETMREVEVEMKTRVRKGGQDDNRTTGNMVWAEFVHTTSRPVEGVPDPQLHAHVFAFNSTWDSQEERWKAGQFRELKRDAPYFQAAFRVRLANRLQDVGFGIERKRDDFEITGIKPDLLKRFSRRTTLIEKLAAEKGITDPNRKAELGAESREKKSKALTMEQLRDAWGNRMTVAERHTLEGVSCKATKYERQQNGESQAVDHAIDHSFVRDAVVPERKLLTEALKRGLGMVTVEATARELRDRPLIRSDVLGRWMATTNEMVSLENKIVEFARNGRGRCRPLGDPARACSRDWFNEGQKKAVAHVLGSRDRVMVIRGVAGTGKTTLEQEIGEALAEAGRPVVAIAQSAKASREVLRNEAGFAEADTVARFVKDQTMQQSVRNGVILVDEASLLGTRDMHKLFTVAEELNARVLLVGDRRQHRSVTAGEPLKLLEENAGLPVAEVTDILRQQGDYKKAARALSQGRSKEAFGLLDKLGWIREVPDAERNQQIADAYLSAVAEKKRGGEFKSALIVSPTHAEGALVTAAVREGLKASGKLADERTVTTWVSSRLTDAEKADPTQYEPGHLVQFHQNSKGFKKGTRLIVKDEGAIPTQLANRFDVYRPVPMTLAVGDRIRITAGGKTKNGKHQLSNGTLLTVAGFTKKGDIIADHGWVIDRDFGHLAPGYVVTSYSSQGATVDKVIVSISSQSLPATDQRTAYVAITRGKEQALVFTDDRSELLRAIGREDQTLSATELAEASETGAKDSPQKRPTYSRIRGLFANWNDSPQQTAASQSVERGLSHDR